MTTGVGQLLTITSMRGLALWAGTRYVVETCFTFLADQGDVVLVLEEKGRKTRLLLPSGQTGG